MSDKKVVLGNTQAKKDASKLKELSMRTHSLAFTLRGHVLTDLFGDGHIWNDPVSARLLKKMEDFVKDIDKAADKLEECANDMEAIANSVK